MEVKIMTENACMELYGNVKSNLNRYSEKDVWAKQYLQDKKMLAPIYKNDIIEFSNIERLNFKYNEDGKKEYLNDADNAIMLFKAFGNFGRKNAADAGFWISLTHTNQECYEYTQKRWQSKSPDQTSNIINHFFFGKSNYGDTAIRERNALSRLYWTALLTYDKSNKNDPYEYTRVLFSSEMIHNNIILSPTAKSPVRMKGTMEALKISQKDIPNNLKTDFPWLFCRVIMQINSIAKGCQLDKLTVEENRDIVLNQYDIAKKDYPNLKEERDRIKRYQNGYQELPLI